MWVPGAAVVPASVASSDFRFVPIAGTGFPATIVSVPESNIPLPFTSYSTGSPEFQEALPLRSRNFSFGSDFRVEPGMGVFVPAIQASPKLIVRLVLPCGIMPRMTNSAF